MRRLAMLDDYQGVSLDIADWSALDGVVEVTAYRNHVTDEGALA